jgi:glycosyltransferase involved in cell wall biosynthesis
MKIAIFSDTFPPQVNGVANSVHQSAFALQALGHEVYVFTVSSKNNFELQKSIGNKYTIFSLPSLPAPVYAGERLGIPVGFSFKIIKTIKPHVLHVHTPFSVGWEAVLMKQLFKIPLIGTHHTFYDHYVKHLKMDFFWMRKLSWKYTIAYYNQCDLVLSPSQSLAKQLINYGLKRNIKVVPNFIDVDFFKPVSGMKERNKLKEYFGLNNKLLIYMGRLSYEKSIDQILLAFKISLQDIKNLKLLLVGDGPEKKFLEKLAKNLGLEEKVLFLGFRYNNELVKILQAGDIFLTMSKSENMPLSVLEALATGLPVIAPDALGLPEIVINGYNGFLVTPDDYKGMSQKIIELIKNEKLRKKFSFNARCLAINYSKNKISQLLNEIYQEYSLKDLH